MVNSFVYLGSCITTDCEIREEISIRIGKAAKLLDVYEVQSFAIIPCLLILKGQYIKQWSYPFFCMGQRHGQSNLIV